MNRLPRDNAKNHPGTQGTVAPTGCHAIGNNLSRFNAAGPPLAIFHLKQEARGVSECTSSLPQRDNGLPNGRPHWHSSSKSTTERENRLRRSRTPPLTAFVCLFFVKTRTCQRYVASSCDVNFPREHRTGLPRPAKAVVQPGNIKIHRLPARALTWAKHAAGEELMPLTNSFRYTLFLLFGVCPYFFSLLLRLIFSRLSRMTVAV